MLGISLKKKEKERERESGIIYLSPHFNNVPQLKKNHKYKNA